MITQEDKDVMDGLSRLAEKMKSLIERHRPALEHLIKGKLPDDPKAYPLRVGGLGDGGVSVVTGDKEVLITWEELEHYYVRDLDPVQEAIMALPSPRRQFLTDGYHSFEELYRFRVIYTALLFSIWHSHYPNKYSVSKSFKHHDGKSCFSNLEDWFIVTVVITDVSGSTTQISHHYHREYWNLFNVPSYEKSPVPFDGHTSGDVLQRLFELRGGVHGLHK